MPDFDMSDCIVCGRIVFNCKGHPEAAFKAAEAALLAKEKGRPEPPLDQTALDFTSRSAR